MNSSDIAQDLQHFRMEMLMYRPFFGDILLRLPIIQDDSIRTACTDGWTIRWNSRFLSGMNSAQRHYVLMHEVLHTLLMHPSRMQEHDHEIWNIAADMVVNRMCDNILNDVNRLMPEPLMERPADGIFAALPQDMALEDLYGLIAKDYKKRGGKGIVKKDYRPFARNSASDMAITPDADLMENRGPGGHVLTAEEQKQLEERIKALVRSAGAKDRGAFGSYYIPRELVLLTQPKPVSWRRLLKEHLTEITSDDASYATPERKYLHMDMILPGYCQTQDGDLETLWAFVDSSGSISGEELNQFLTQLYRIVREFHCELNLCYWDTQVTDVYRKIRQEKRVLDCRPRHSGGTDINCVYRWMRDNHVRPDVMLILTDGYFGPIGEDVDPLLRPRDTILVISNDSTDEAYRRIGKICRVI